jgi:hypothetical protein
VRGLHSAAGLKRAGSADPVGGDGLPVEVVGAHEGALLHGGGAPVAAVVLELAVAGTKIQS